jgi:hypothetical protein
MNKKLNNIKEAEYYANFNYVGAYIVKSRKAKPNNEPLNKMYFAWQEVAFYVNNLITEQRYYNKSLGEYRADKIRAIERARLSDKKVQELEEQLNKYKALYG